MSYQHIPVWLLQSWVYFTDYSIIHLLSVHIEHIVSAVNLTSSLDSFVSMGCPNKIYRNTEQRLQTFKMKLLLVLATSFVIKFQELQIWSLIQTHHSLVALMELYHGRIIPKNCRRGKLTVCRSLTLKESNG